LDRSRVLLGMAAAQLQEIVPVDEARIVAIGPEAAWFDVDDLLDVRKAIDHFHDLVRLFLIFCQVDLRTRVREQVFDLGRRIRRRGARRYGADGDPGEAEDYPLGAVPGMARSPVAALATESEQAMRCQADTLPQLGP